MVCKYSAAYLQFSLLGFSLSMWLH